ncbi:ROK family glucokinase [Rhodococcus aetherivorans]|uniref:Glucokinase n=1 Tax=Rhodococcus aetherivorans TaxID=191292 RepID=A0A059MJG0_9NOCA|nr:MULTISPECIES: ROK family glucokinase [Rhodococcus]ETT25880.1 glucokinase, ROK family [Rhodococcus rhodochrous ATCC 21198]AKE92038.1 glucokinase [Rhodococcus aetherivorans]ANZ27704.1 glucokinase [Rhodococcus sp. WB1]KDE11162.1 glucokinase [Rhodococcus aetherivorans]MDV6293030.1 ROK family glucokinase [Rhodococcus aetherivorans]
MALTIGIDVGGTKVAAGVVDEHGTLHARLRRATPSDDPARTEDVVADVVRELRAAHDVCAVGIGAAGFVASDRRTVLFAPNLAWRGEPLGEAVEAACGLPTVVENDANAAAWGEARFGAGRGARTAIVLTVGTGIGGGLIIDGALHRGASGLAAELGHLNVEPHGRRCGCGNHGCWERYASGRALVREAQEIASVSPALAGRLLELAGGRAEQITGHHVTTAAREGDAAALECFRTIGTWLGHGMADLAAFLDPEVFVLGGGVCEAGELLRGPAVATFAQRLTGRGHRPAAPVRLAELGPDAGIVGAADLARRRTDLSATRLDLSAAG